MAIAANVVAVDNLQHRMRKILLLTFSGSYSSLGDTLDLTKVTNTKNLEAALFHRNPDLFRLANPAPAGWVLEITPGTGLTNWLVLVRKQDGSTGKLPEIAAGAYDATLTGATNIYLELEEKAS